jgi:voltage-gated potassium channel Kch
MWRTAGRIAALALLLFTGVVGIDNGIDERTGITNGLQAVVTTGVFVYGVLGLAAFLAVLRHWRSAAWLVVLWGIDITMVATLAPLAYGGPDVPLVGALAGGLATALVACGIWWITIRSARTASSPAPESRVSR